jgi:uncharacterized protein YjbJ (UPF0337 family)
MRAKMDKLKGSAKQIEGKLTGDKIRTAQGTVQRMKGEIEGVVGRIARDVKRGVRRARGR